MSELPDFHAARLIEGVRNVQTVVAAAQECPAPDSRRMFRPVQIFQQIFQLEGSAVFLEAVGLCHLEPVERGHSADGEHHLVIRSMIAVFNKFVVQFFE